MDINKIRASLNSITNPNEGRTERNDLVKLPKGEHTIRFVPYKFDKDMPFQELHFHYGINNATFLCPKRMNGDDCPICDFAGEVWGKFKLTEDETYKETFKSLMPKNRVYVPIIVKKSSDEALVDITKVKFWGIAPKTYEEILNEIITADAEGIDVTDVAKGLDFTVRMDNFAGRKDRFCVKSVKGARSQTPLIEGTKKEVEALIDTCVDIFSIFEFKPIADMETALEKHFGTDESKKDDMSVGTEKNYKSSDDKEVDEERDVSAEIEEKFAKLTENSDEE